MSLTWTPPRKSPTITDWRDPDYSLWSEPGMSCVKLPSDAGSIRIERLSKPNIPEDMLHQGWVGAASQRTFREPGIPVETHKKMWPVWVVGVAFWLAVGVSVWFWRTW